MTVEGPEAFWKILDESNQEDTKRRWKQFDCSGGVETLEGSAGLRKLSGGAGGVATFLECARTLSSVLVFEACLEGSK